jgi:hypothetical protein
VSVSAASAANRQWPFGLSLTLTYQAIHIAGSAWIRRKKTDDEVIRKGEHKIMKLKVK